MSKYLDEGTLCEQLLQFYTEHFETLQVFFVRNDLSMCISNIFYPQINFSYVISPVN